MCITILSAVQSVSAQSVAVNFSANHSEVTKGDTVAVTLLFDADTDIGDLEAYILYDSTILEFKKGGKYINGGDGTLKLSDDSLDENTPSKKYVMEFEAKKVGESEILLNGKPNVYSYPDSAPMSVSYNGITVKVKAEVTTSSNAKLSSLQISPGKLSPEFKADITEYKVNLEESINKLVVSGKTQDENAKISLNGNENLKYGENKVVLTVTAENGSTKNYTINAVRAEASKTEPEKLPEQTEEELPLPNEEENGGTDIGEMELPPVSSFEVITDGDQTYVQSGYRYELVDLEDESLIPDGFLETKLILYGNSVTAYSKTVNQNEILLLYAKNENGDKNFYRYDKDEKTLQRFRITDSSLDNSAKTVMNTNKYNEKVNQLSLIIAILSALCALLVIGMIKLVLKLKGLNDELD